MRILRPAERVGGLPTVETLRLILRENLSSNPTQGISRGSDSQTKATWVRPFYSSCSGWGALGNNRLEGSAGRAAVRPACRIGSALSIRRVSRSMLLDTNAGGGSSIVLMVSHTRACRSLRSETWAAAPVTVRRLTRRLHRIWHTTDIGGATMMPTRPKASARAMSRTTVRIGLSHLRLKSRGLTHIPRALMTTSA